MQLREMIPEVDTHTHTIISGHAWSTLTENCLTAKSKGMKGLCLTEHGPAIENGAPAFIPHTQRLLPVYVEGIRVFLGTEANILDHEGNIDIPMDYLPHCEFAIASIHSHMYENANDKAGNTRAYLKLLNDPYIDMIGHCDDPRVPCDFEAMILEAQKNNKLLEFNNNSCTGHRPGGSDNVKELIRLCKKHGQKVCVSSDAHFHTMIGSVTPMMTILDELEFPKELIVNLTIERFTDHLKTRTGRVLRQ